MKAQNLLKSLINNSENIIFTGTPGSGKQMIINNILSSVRNVSIITIACNAATSAQDLIKRI